MSRRTLIQVASSFAALILAAVLGGAAVEAAPPGCSLTPIGAEQVQVLQARPRLVDFRAQWTALTSCSNPNHPLHGDTASVRHRTVVLGVGGGDFAGQTRISIEFTGAGLTAELTGLARGPMACAGGLCRLDLDVRANGGGIRLRGEVELVFDPLGISLPQESSKLDFRVNPGGTP